MIIKAQVMRYLLLVLMVSMTIQVAAVDQAISFKWRGVGDQNVADADQVESTTSNNNLQADIDAIMAPSDGEIPMKSGDGFVASPFTVTSDRVISDIDLELPSGSLLLGGNLSVSSGDLSVFYRNESRSIDALSLTQTINTTGSTDAFLQNASAIALLNSQPSKAENAASTSFTFTFTATDNRLIRSVVVESSNTASDVTVEIRPDNGSNPVVMRVENVSVTADTEVTIPLPNILLVVNTNVYHVTVTGSATFKGDTVDSQFVPFLGFNQQVVAFDEILSLANFNRLVLGGDPANDDQVIIVNSDGSRRYGYLPSGGSTGTDDQTAAEVPVSSSNLRGLLLGSGNAQVAFDRIDATGLGAPITTFTGNYESTTANQNEWLNRHLQGADGQSCSRNRFVNLPDLTELGAAFDGLSALGLPEVITITVSYFGCSSTSSAVNALRVNPSSNVDNAPGGFGFRNNVVLNRADSVTLQIERESSTIGSWVVIARGLLASMSGASLDDIELQTRTWSNLDGSFLPSSDDVLKGYAFRVTSSSPNDGTLRQGLIDAGVTDKVIYDGDWVVWSAESYTSWVNGGDWFVIPADDVRRITQQQENLLQESSESDTDDYVRIADDADPSAGVEALVWLVNPDNALTAAPFLLPNTGTNPDPRNNPTVTYIGGRDDRLANNDFVFDLSRFTGNPVIFEGEIIVGITGSYITANNTNDIRLEIREPDGTPDGALITSYNLNSNFVDPPLFSDLSLDYSILSTFNIADSATELRYHSGQILRLVINRPDREFTFSENVKIGTDNIDGGAWQESDLATDVQAKLNRETSISAQDRAAIGGVETRTDTITPIPFNIQMQVRASSATFNDNHYRPLEIGNGLIQDFQETFTYTLRVSNNIELTGFDFTGGQTLSGSVTLTEVLPTLFEGERTYTLVVPPAPDDITYNPLDHPIVPTGTISAIEPVGLVPSIKVDADNFNQPFLDSITNHNQDLPAPIEALNHNAEVFHFDNVDFTSNNDHAGVATMFSFLKNKPDERLGDAVPTSTTLFKEITNSDITATIQDLVGLFYPRTIGGQFDDGVSVATQGALTGAGSVNEPVVINNPNDSNFRLTLGFWFDADPIAENTIRNLIRVKERGATSSRRLFGLEGFSRINSQNLVEQGILITERVFGSAGTSAVVPVPHHLYTTNGEIVHVFSGVGAAETLFRVNEARTYTISAALTANGNSEGSDSFDVTIANINQDQNFGNHALTYMAGGHPHTQNVTVEYVANSSTYGGPGHTLRFELLDGLADNSNFDIDHLSVSAGYTTQETITTPASYAEANAGGTPLIKSRKKHRAIFSFRKSSSNDNLIAQYVITGFDSNNNPIVSSSNEVDFGYSVFDLDWSQVTLGNTNAFIAQNIQGFFLNTDTPLSEFPTHDILNGWISSHDDKVTDYVWDNADAPMMDIEAVRFPENLNLSNLILEDTENTDRFYIRITDGVVTPVKIQ